MKKIKILILLIILPIIISAQDMRQNAFQSLFSDYKASRIGDAVTILVVESSQASNQASKRTDNESDVGFNLSGTMDGEPMLPKMDFDVGSRDNFEGSGVTRSQGMVKTKLSARIDSVLANGDLRIIGSRKITINGEEQMIQIKGIVRTGDIKHDNSVYSYNISDMEIVFEGKGDIEDAQSPGFLSKIFHWIF
ncbi:MAG: flagellar basal body L-ring protein FlgH [Melioribacteraceae bacterium]|nr:flagellar basal body L-ring protein FlgH [Melioribacteraceae bacterium]